MVAHGIFVEKKKICARLRNPLRSPDEQHVSCQHPFSANPITASVTSWTPHSCHGRSVVTSTICYTDLLRPSVTPICYGDLGGASEPGLHHRNRYRHVTKLVQARSKLKGAAKKAPALGKWDHPGRGEGHPQGWHSGNPAILTPNTPISHLFLWHLLRRSL